MFHQVFSCVISFSNFLVILCLLIKLVCGVPVNRNIRSNTNHDRFTDYSDSVQNYLMDFGYLPKSNIETGNLRTESQLRDAIRNFQKFGNIPETGLIDNRTKELMTKPRCGVSDNPDQLEFYAENKIYVRRRKRFAVGSTKWDHTNLTWSLVRQADIKLDVGHVRRILYDALEIWAGSSKLTFREVSEHSNDADLEIFFASGHHGDGFDFDGPGQVLAHAFYPGPKKGGDIHFDADERWVIFPESEEGTSFMAVAVHELGHSLGLSHSSVQGAIMFPWYNGEVADKELPEDDRLGIQEIYGVPEKQWGDNNYPHYRPHHRSTTTTTTRRPTPRPTTTTTTRRPTTTTTTTTTTTQRPYRRPEYIPPRYNPPRTNHPRQRPNYDDNNHQHHHHHNHNIPTKPVERNPPYYPFQPEIKRPKKPNTCDTEYDEIALIRNELFIFKDRYLWRISSRDGLLDGYPHEISWIWTELPRNLERIDAVYENKKNQIVFFIGKLFYVFNSNVLERGYPRPLTDLGLPYDLPKIDAVLVWGHNNQTYFFSGTMYWKFDETQNHVELDYPRDMSIWQGIGYDIDAAFQYKDGKTYFFKGKSYWRFDDMRMRIAHIDPLQSSHKWMGCSIKRNQDVETRRPTLSVPSRRNEHLIYDDATFEASSSTASQRSQRAIGSLGFLIILLQIYYF